MKIFVKYDIPMICKTILEEQLEKLGLAYELPGFTEIELQDQPTKAQFKELQENLSRYGIEIVETQKSSLVQKTKDVIIEMIYLENTLPESKISSYLAKKLNHSYGYISNIFSEETYTSIESYIILQKIERSKQLILTRELSFTEIAWKLNYSSVAHFSTQFKNVTGLTPSAFQRIIVKRLYNE